MAIAHNGTNTASIYWLAIAFCTPTGINLMNLAIWKYPIAIVCVGTRKIMAQFMRNGAECPGINRQRLKKKINIGKSITVICAQGI